MPAVADRLFTALALTPEQTAELDALMVRYPYFETPYLLKIIPGEPAAEDLHRAALVCGNSTWVQALREPVPVAGTGPEPVTEVAVQPEPEPENLSATTAATPEIVAAAPALPEVVEPAKEPETAEPVPAATAAEEAGSEIAFEPYHTIDYFASQGIKPPREILPNDQFANQLKRFTEWLKTMKKLPAGQPEEALKPAQQQAVEQLAETSLKKTDVLTEAMAEVLVKQGRVAEAIEIYQKLSLHDKGKSAYFAARIQHLKTI